MRMLCLFFSTGDSEVQRTMLELLNQLDGFEATKNIKVELAATVHYCVNVLSSYCVFLLIVIIGYNGH